MSGATAAISLVGMGVQAYGAYNQSKATKAGYEAQAVVNRNNATLAEWQAQDALARGSRTEQTQRLKTAQLKGSQRAALAANGVSLDEGSALNILNDTDYMGELDAQTLRDNAAREAWGYRNQVAGYKSDSSLLNNRANAENPSTAATSSLLTNAGSVASSWYSRKTTGG